jgi:hypothetical protein
MGLGKSNGIQHTSFRFQGHLRAVLTSEARGLAIAKRSGVPIWTLAWHLRISIMTGDEWALERQNDAK